MSRSPIVDIVSPYRPEARPERIAADCVIVLSQVDARLERTLLVMQAKPTPMQTKEQLALRQLVSKVSSRITHVLGDDYPVAAEPRAQVPEPKDLVSNDEIDLPIESQLVAMKPVVEEVDARLAQIVVCDSETLLGTLRSVREQSNLLCYRLTRKIGDEFACAPALLEGDPSADRSDPMREALEQRLYRVMTTMTHEATSSGLASSLAAPTDFDALMRMLMQQVESAKKVDPLAGAKLRGLLARQDLLPAKSVLSADDVAGRIGLTRQAVDKRRRAGHLLAVQTERRGYCYPDWQLKGDRVLSGLETVLEALGGHDPWMKLRFFLAKSIRLGRTPLDALRAGKVDEVVAAARAYGEHGAD
jgi:hypothetical protein